MFEFGMHSSKQKYNEMDWQLSGPPWDPWIPVNTFSLRNFCRENEKFGYCELDKRRRSMIFEKRCENLRSFNKFNFEISQFLQKCVIRRLNG